MIFDYLPASYNGDETARGKMHVAQCLAGMAFSNALLGIAHSLAHKVGAQYEIPHGCCNAILLPNVIRYNSKACLSRYADIARYIGLTGKDDQELTDKLVEKVEQLSRALCRRMCSWSVCPRSPRTPSPTPAPAPTRARPRPKILKRS